MNIQQIQSEKILEIILSLESNEILCNLYVIDKLSILYPSIINNIKTNPEEETIIIIGKKIFLNPYMNINDLRITDKNGMVLTDLRNYGFSIDDI